MTAPRPRDPWGDDAIDRVLRDALDVEPTPGFRARVSRRVALEPEPGRHAPWVRWAGMAATLAVAVVWGSMSGGRPPDAVPADRRAPLVEEGRPVAPSAVTQPLLVVPAPTRGAGATASEARQPEALPRFAPDPAPAGARFDPRERDAFAWFLSLSRDGSMPPPAFLPSVALDAGVAVAPIEIPAIDVSHLSLGLDEADPGVFHP